MEALETRKKSKSQGDGTSSVKKDKQPDPTSSTPKPEEKILEFKQHDNHLQPHKESEGGIVKGSSRITSISRTEQSENLSTRSEFEGKFVNHSRLSLSEKDGDLSTKFTDRRSSNTNTIMQPGTQHNLDISGDLDTSQANLISEKPQSFLDFLQTNLKSTESSINRDFKKVLEPLVSQQLPDINEEEEHEEIKPRSGSDTSIDGLKSLWVRQPSRTVPESSPVPEPKDQNPIQPRSRRLCQWNQIVYIFTLAVLNAGLSIPFTTITFSYGNIYVQSLLNQGIVGIGFGSLCAYYLWFMLKQAAEKYDLSYYNFKGIYTITILQSGLVAGLLGYLIQDGPSTEIFFICFGNFAIGVLNMFIQLMFNFFIVKTIEEEAQEQRTMREKAHLAITEEIPSHHESRSPQEFKPHLELKIEALDGRNSSRQQSDKQTNTPAAGESKTGNSSQAQERISQLDEQKRSSALGQLHHTKSEGSEPRSTFSQPGSLNLPPIQRDLQPKRVSFQGISSLKELKSQSSHQNFEQGAFGEQNQEEVQVARKRSKTVQLDTSIKSPKKIRMERRSLDLSKKGKIISIEDLISIYKTGKPETRPRKVSFNDSDQILGISTLTRRNSESALQTNEDLASPTRPRKASNSILKKKSLIKQKASLEKEPSVGNEGSVESENKTKVIFEKKPMEVSSSPNPNRMIVSLEEESPTLTPVQPKPKKLEYKFFFKINAILLTLVLQNTVSFAYGYIVTFLVSNKNILIYVVYASYPPCMGLFQIFSKKIARSVGNGIGTITEISGLAFTSLATRVIILQIKPQSALWIIICLKAIYKLICYVGSGLLILKGANLNRHGFGKNKNQTSEDPEKLDSLKNLLVKFGTLQFMDLSFLGGVLLVVVFIHLAGSKFQWQTYASFSDSSVILITEVFATDLLIDMVLIFAIPAFFSWRMRELEFQGLFREIKCHFKQYLAGIFLSSTFMYSMTMMIVNNFFDKNSVDYSN